MPNTGALFPKYRDDPRSSVQQMLLAIGIDAQQTLGDCPWCDVQIGASLHHWANGCPFKAMNELIQVIDRRAIDS